MPIKQYEIVGRKKPTDADKNPKIYRMKVFAPNTVVAKSRFWYYLSLLKNVKRQNGEVLEVHQIYEKRPDTVKNYSVLVRYDSRSGTHNMVKEYRATTMCGAISQLYQDMAARHRARRSAVQIVACGAIPAKDCQRPYTTQFHDSQIKFKLLHRIPRPANKSRTSTFRASAPNSFF